MPHCLFPMQKSAFTRFLNSCTSCSHFSTVMFNFTGQLDWPKGSAHSGQNMISRCVCFGCFWKRLAFESVACIREMTLIRICGHPPICWRHEGNQNLEGGQIYSLAGASVFSCLGALVLRVLRPGLTPLAPWFSILTFDLGWHPWLSWGSSWQAADLGASQPL